nr:hypothetical protein [Tanacetum cinerariifolium]
MSASGILLLPEVDGIDEGNGNDEVGSEVYIAMCSSSSSSLYEDSSSSSLSASSSDKSSPSSSASLSPSL